MNTAIHLVTQSVVHGQPRIRLPAVLEVEIVGFTTHACFIELSANRSERRRYRCRVGVRSGCQQSDQRIWQGIANIDVVRAAGRRYEHLRICRTAAERICPIRSDSKNRGITVDTDFGPPLERVLTVSSGPILAQLIQIRVRAEDRPSGGVVALK